MTCSISFVVLIFECLALRISSFCMSARWWVVQAANQVSPQGKQQEHRQFEKWWQLWWWWWVHRPVRWWWGGHNRRLVLQWTTRRGVVRPSGWCWRQCPANPKQRCAAKSWKLTTKTAIMHQHHLMMITHWLFQSTVHHLFYHLYQPHKLVKHPLSSLAC